MKKILLLILIGIMTFALCACSNSGDEQKKERNAIEITDEPITGNDKTVSPSGLEQNDERPTDAAEKITEAPTAIPTSSTDTTVSPEPTAVIEPTVTEPVITEPVIREQEYPGPVVDTLPNMGDVFKAYYDYARSLMDEPDYTLFDTLRFGLALIDNDDLPELLIAEDSYHGSMVKVIFYNGGDLKEAGSFGSYGGFSYIKMENHIMSFYMNNGIRTLFRYRIENDYSLTAVKEFIADDNGDGGYKIDGEEVEAEVFDEEYELASDPEYGNKKIFVEYENLLPYYPYLTSTEYLDAFDLMYEQLLDPEYERFSGYTNEKMEKLYGSWSLIKGEAYFDNQSLYYNPNGTEESNAQMTSEVTISRDNGVGMWLSTYIDNKPYDPLTTVSYAMPMLFFNGGISEGIDYGWSVKAVPEFSDWEFYLCLDDNGHLILAMFRALEDESDGDGNPTRESVVLTYDVREDDGPGEDVEDGDDGKGQDDGNTEDSLYKISCDITRQENKDIDGKKAFSAKEYLIVRPDDTDLISKYGLPEDLDGYDFEMVESDREPFTFYVDESTEIQIIDFSEGIKYININLNAFLAGGLFGTYNLYFDAREILSSTEGLTVKKMVMDYLD